MEWRSEYDDLQHSGNLFYFAQWTVRGDAMPVAQEAVKDLLANYLTLGDVQHDEIRSVRCWKNMFSGEPRWTFRWLEEYDDYVAVQNRPEREAQRDAWLRVLQYAEPTTYTGGLWWGTHQNLWTP